MAEPRAKRVPSAPVTKIFSEYVCPKCGNKLLNFCECVDPSVGQPGHKKYYCLEDDTLFRESGGHILTEYVHTINPYADLATYLRCLTGCKD